MSDWCTPLRRRADLSQPSRGLSLRLQDGLSVRCVQQKLHRYVRHKVGWNDGLSEPWTSGQRVAPLQLLVLQCGASKDDGTTAQAAAVPCHWSWRCRSVLTFRARCLWFGLAAGYQLVICTVLSCGLRFSCSRSLSAGNLTNFFVETYDAAFCIFLLLYTN